MLTFLDAAYFQSLPQFTAALKATGAQGFAFYIGGNNALHDTEPSIVAALLVAGYQGMAIYVPALNHDGAADGQDAVAAAHRYNLSAGFKVCVDIEPSNFNRAGLVFSRAYSDAWHDGVRAAGYSPGPYGTPATVADCADRADYIWIAEPGQPDPTAAGLAPGFFAGKRMIQFGQGTVDGVTYDLNHSQISLSSLPSTGGNDLTDAELVTLHHIIQWVCFGSIDPSGQQAFVDAVKAGTGMNTIFDGWYGSAPSQAWRARLAAAGIPGPQGPKGDPGPPGATPTQFKITGTGTTTA